MDFSDALIILKNGGKVARTLWSDGRAHWDGSYVVLDTLPAPFDPQLMVRYPDDRTPKLFTCAQWDIMAEDWEVVE
jgi:hypothetical protein